MPKGKASRSVPVKAILLLGVLVFWSCDDATDTDGQMYLVVSPDEVQLVQHQSVQLQVSVFDQDSVSVTGISVSFVAADPSIVRVSLTGLVESVGPIGTSTVTVNAADLSQEVRVEVVALPALAGRIPINGVGFGIAARDGLAYVTLAGSNAVDRLDLDEQSTTGSVTVGPVPTSITLNPAGTRAYVSNQFGQSISVIDLSSFQAVGSLSVSGDPVPLRVSGDGQALLVGTNLNRLYELTLPSGTLVDSVALPATSHHIEFNGSRTRLYVATRAGGTVMEIDPQNMSVLRTFSSGGLTQGLVVTPDGSELWVANEAGGIEVWSLDSGSRITTVSPDVSAFGLAANASGSLLFAGVLSEQAVLVIDRAGRHVIATLSTGGTPRHMALDSTTGYVVVANEDGWVDLIR